MCKKPVVFNPTGKDLSKVFHYYGLPQEEKMICPFHDDSRPSFHVDFDEGIFHCFACQVSGDALDFVKLANPKLNGLAHLRLYHAIMNSKKVSKLKFKNYRPSKSRKQKEEDRQSELEISHDFYHGLKKVDWRKVESEFKDYMLDRGFTEKALNLCGAKLTITNDNYPLIFPIMDMDEFKGYVCRTTKKHIEKKRKYLYNKGFSRKDTVVGRYDNEVVVLVEGYMDLLKMRQFGVKYAAAIFGWKITSIQVQKLKARGVKTIISALDMDKPGRDGTDYLANFFNVVRFQFPKGVKDPGDLSEKQFRIANRKTKTLYRRRKNVNFK